MGGYVYTGVVIFIAITIKTMIWGRWEAFKAREALKTQPTKQLKSGQYVIWGRVQKIERAGNIWLVIWAVYIAILIGLLIYMKAMGLHSLW